MRWYQIKAMERSHHWKITRRGGPEDTRQCSACDDDEMAEVRYCTGIVRTTRPGAIDLGDDPDGDNS